jgi:hypothetical protein
MTLGRGAVGTGVGDCLIAETGLGDGVAVWAGVDLGSGAKRTLGSEARSARSVRGDASATGTMGRGRSLGTVSVFRRALASVVHW